MRNTLLACLLLGASLAHAAEPLSPPTFRLGDLAAPKRYEARLTASPREDRFDGEIRITVELGRASPIVWLNATGLTIDSARITQGAREVGVKVVEGGEDFVGLASTAEPFAAGPAVIAISYHGAVEGVAAQGLFRKRYEDAPYLYTQFEETDARRTFPCFDEPGFKAPWQVTIDAPAGNVVVSNTPEKSVADAPGKPGWRRHEFKATQALPTYLVAFAIGPFDVVDGGTAGQHKVPLRFIVPKGHAAEARLARDNTARIVDLLEGYFGIPYPFEKLDSVAVPQLGGAMENAAMITYDALSLIARPHEETDDSRRRYVSVAAHEIAHQWFGDYMTLGWWDDTWLNEAFATWIGQKTMYRVNPAWDDGFEQAWSRRRAVDSDRLASARKIHNPVADKGDIRAAFDGITYYKGAEVLAMFEAGIGPDKFRQGVSLFLRRHAWASATSSDFFRAIAEASGSTDETLRAFRAFVDQSAVPLINAALQCNDGRATLELTQARLKPAGSRAADARWSTPVCFRYPGSDGAAHSQCTTIAGDAGRLALDSCPAWIVGNEHGAGHYVVRYDAPLAAANAKGFSAVGAHEAIALLGDAALLSKSGLQPLDVALDWADAGLQHPSPYVKSTAATLLDEQRDTWLDASQARRKREIVERRLVPLAERVGWKPRPGEGRGIVRLRGVLMPIAAKQEAGGRLRAEANAMARAWMDDRAAIDADVAQAALDTAARFADAAMLDRFRDALRTSTSQRDQRSLLKALAKVREPRQRERALGFTLAQVEGQDVMNGSHVVDFLDYALGDDDNRVAAFDYIRDRFEPLVAKVPRDSPTRIIQSMDDLCTSRDKAAFTGFFAGRAPRFVGGEVAYRQSLESIELCVAARGS